jgi:hypothetical protein
MAGRGPSGLADRVGAELGQWARRALLAKIALPAGLAAIVVGIVVMMAALLVAPGSPPGAGCAGANPVSLNAKGIPRDLVPIYEKAATDFRLGPRGAAVLASINKTETNFGRATLPGVHAGTNSAGAAGPMQFLLSTWASYGVDGNGDGRRDVYEPADAIPAAAKYLRASGAPASWYRAVFSYNHADWYVQGVLRQANAWLRKGGLDSDGLGSNAELATLTANDAGGACDAPSADATGRLGKLIASADRMDARHYAYSWGGGHNTQFAPSGPNQGYDCSGSWSRILHDAGFGNPPMTSTEFMSWGEPGPGTHITIYADGVHIYGTINGRVFGTSGMNPGGGAGWFKPGHNPYRHFAAVRHPPGL